MLAAEQAGEMAPALQVARGIRHGRDFLAGLATGQTGWRSVDGHRTHGLRQSSNP
jgi:hypothetical protein